MFRNKSERDIYDWQDCHLFSTLTLTLRVQNMFLEVIMRSRCARPRMRVRRRPGEYPVEAELELVCLRESPDSEKALPTHVNDAFLRVPHLSLHAQSRPQKFRPCGCARSA